MLFGELALPAQVFEGALQFFCQVLKHDSHRFLIRLLRISANARECTGIGRLLMPDSRPSCGTIETLWRKRFKRTPDLGVKPGRLPGKKKCQTSWKKLLWSLSPQATRPLGTPAARDPDRLLAKTQPKRGRRSVSTSGFSSLHYFASVMPLLQVLCAGVLLHMLCHSPHQICRGHRLPAMSLHRPSISEFAFRIVQLPAHLLKFVHCQIQIKIVHVSDVDMNLAFQLRP